MPGAIERLSTQRHSLGYYHNVGVTARYTSPPGQRLSRLVLFKALEAAIYTHASLGLTILNEDTATPHFARLNTIDLDEVVTFVQLSGTSDEAQQQEFDKILSEQHSVPFRKLGQLPVWRVLLIEPEKYDAERGVDVVFIYHHGMGDGATGQAFHMTLLKSLERLPPSKEEEEAHLPYLVTPPALPLLEPLESLVPLPLSPAFVFHTLWTRVWFTRPRPPTFWSGPLAHLPPSGLKTCLRTVAFSPQTVSRLLSACRAEKTTITALLQALIAKSFFSTLPASTTTSLSSTIAVNLRRHMPAPITDETMGVFVCSIAANHSRTKFEQTPLWDLARKYRRKLASRVDSGTRNADVGMLKHVDDFEKHCRGQVGKSHENTFELSNLGVFKGCKSTAGWDVPTRMLFSQSASVSGSAVDFSAMSVKGGEMVLGVGYQVGVVEPEFVARLVAALKSEVEGIATGVENVK